MDTLLERVIEHEGFESKPYQDHLGNWTFGHGLTFITRDESEYIVDKRLADFAQKHIDQRAWLTERPQVVLEVVTEMAYQMGFAGTNAFVQMWIALLEKDYARAADEMLDSRWAKQTPERAKQMSELIRQC